jgi:flagellar basal body-associated protein FliL
MDESYENESYDQDYEPAPRRRMSGWLIVLIVILVLIVVCCLCALFTLLLTGPAVGNVFSTVIETIEATTPGP